MMLPRLTHHESTCGRPAPSSPRSDVGALLAGAWCGRRRRAQSGENPAARLERVDNVVELEMRGTVQRLTLLIHPRHHLFEKLLARGRLTDRLQLLAVAELRRALQSHPPTLAGRPRDG